MRIVGPIHLVLFCCRFLQISAEAQKRIISPIEPPTESPTAHTHHPAYQQASESPSDLPTASPTTSPTASPTATPTKAPTCIGNSFVATFSSPTPNANGAKAVTGKLKGFYQNKDTATLEFKVKFGNFQFNDVDINKGDFIDWSVNTMWQDNPGKSGWNNKCREARTGLHYDPTIACSALSENLITPAANERRKLVTHRRLAPNVPYCIENNGNTVKAEDYECKPKKVQKTCERGDLSGKLGQLKVKKKSGQLMVKFKGTDKFFPRKNAALQPETEWSIVLSKDGKRFLCAQFVLLCD